MRLICKNCGELPIALPDLPKEFPGTKKMYDHRLSTCTPCPECGRRGNGGGLKIEDGLPSRETLTRRIWKDPKSIATIQRIFASELSDMSEQAELVRNVYEGRGRMVRKDGHESSDTDSYLSLSDKNDYSPSIALDTPRSYPISSFPEFMRHFFECADEAYSERGWEEGYLDHLKRADVFFLGEETEMMTHTEDVCQSGRLPFLMPFKNCLFFMRTSEVGSWDVVHLYQIEDFLGRWNVPDNEGARRREVDLLKAVSLHENKALGYRIWRSGPDIYDNCTRGTEAHRVPTSAVKYQMYDQAHVAINPSLEYEKGMWARLRVEPIAPTYTRSQANNFANLMCGIDMVFNVTAISAPSLYTVKVTPRKTKREKGREKRGIVDQGRRNHFIILDYNRVTHLNPGNLGSGASPRPHKRRAHWRQVGPNYRHLLARGIVRIPVREAIIGKDRFEDEKNQYHVLTEFFAGGEL